MESTKTSFKHSGIGKALKWLCLVLFIFFLSLTFFSYNVMTVVNEKSIKQMGTKFVSGMLENNKESVDPTIPDLIKYAKENPNTSFKMNTGIKDITIEVNTNELAKLNKDDFYAKFPALASDSIYDNTLNSILNENLKVNENMPFISEKINSKNRYSVTNNSFYYLVFLTLLACGFYYILNDPKKFLFNVGIIISLITFPIYLTFYILNPFVSSLIRKLDFVVANMAVDALSRIQFNYFKFFIGGVLIILAGLLIQSDFKGLFRKKGEYEKIIK